MRYIKFTGGTGYCGCDIEEYCEYDDSITDSELDSVAEEMAYEQGETYGYVATGWGEDWECEEDREAYFEGCSCEWEEISKEEYEENKR